MLFRSAEDIRVKSRKAVVHAESEIKNEYNRDKKVAVKKRGMQLMRHFAGDSGFSAAGNAHQDIDVVIMVSRAQSVLPLDWYAAPGLTNPARRRRIG